MLNIQVLGKGLIPRGLGIAPRMEPFPADFTLISTIMHTDGLRVRMINPNDGKPIDLTPNNVKRMWDKYGKSIPKKSRNITVNMPAKPADDGKEKKEPQIYTPVNQKPEQYKEVPKDMIQETVQNTAATVFGNNDNIPPVELPKNNESEGSTEENTENETDQDGTAKPADDGKEKKDNNAGNNSKNNGGKNQPFKPINNPKQK